MQQQQQQQNMTATAAAASSLLLPFPYKLYEMIEYASNSEFSSSLSWSADGTCFIIYDKDAMMDNLAPKFFKLTQYRSFVSVFRYIDSIDCHLELHAHSNSLLVHVFMSATFNYRHGSYIYTAL